MEKAVIYARYSSDNQREESIEGQVREITAYAKKNGIMIVHQYIDRALSAKTDDRPDFQRMIEDSRSKQFTMVLVWKLDRFSRDRYDMLKYKAILKNNGVKLVSINERIDDSPEGILMESLLSGLAEYYSADLAQKVRRGMTENVLHGKSTGQPPVLGYYVKEDGSFGIDEQGAAIVRTIFSMYTKENLGMGEIRKRLKSMGIHRQNGKPLTWSTIERILTNPKYIGIMTFGDIVNEKAFPPIIDKATFEAAVQKRNSNSRRPHDPSHHEPYILVGKIFCGKCGATVASDGTLKKNGTYYRWYKCINRKKRGECDLPGFPKKELEDAVVNDALSLIKGGILEKVVDDVMESQSRKSPEQVAMESELKDIEKKLNNLLSAIEQGIVLETTKARMIELEGQKNRLMKSLSDLSISKETFTREQVEYYLTQFSILDPNADADREKIVSLFVNSVYLYPDGSVEIAYNWGGPVHRVKLNHVKEPKPKSSNLDSIGPPNGRQTHTRLILVSKGRFALRFAITKPMEPSIK